MPLDEDSKKFTAVITPTHGLVEFNYLPFGIKTSPGWFQRGMDRAFKSCNDFASIYIDDVNFGADDENEHYNKLEKILYRM